MKIALFGTQPYDREYFEQANQSFAHQLIFLEDRLDASTAKQAAGCEAVCAFVNDRLDADCLQQLQTLGINNIALRAAGFNNVDLACAQQLGICVMNVPCYSPQAVAEHALALIMSLQRHLIEADARVRANNFTLNGLLGSNLHGKTVGVIGTGRIGEAFCRIMLGFGTRVIAYDIAPNARCRELGVEYVELNELIRSADIISLHCPLCAQNQYLIDDTALGQMKTGAMLINTARGGLLDTRAAIQHLRSGQLGYLGLDVYEHEAGLFFGDHSQDPQRDPLLQELLELPNVLVTAHQAFFTEQALSCIAQTTLSNLSDIEAGRQCPNQLSAK